MSIPRIDEKPYGFGFPTYFSRDGGMIHDCRRLVFFTRGLCHEAKPCHTEVALKNDTADTGQEFFNWLYAQLSSGTVQLPEKMQGNIFFLCINLLWQKQNQDKNKQYPVKYFHHN